MKKIGQRLVPQATIDRRVAAKDRRFASVGQPRRRRPHLFCRSSVMCYYVLDDDGKTPIKVATLIEWVHWLDGRPRYVAETTIGEARVSTVFLGLDYGLRPGRAPVLWETMVFGGALDMSHGRYRSYDEALTGHASACECVRAAEAQGLINNA